MFYRFCSVESLVARSLNLKNFNDFFQREIDWFYLKRERSEKNELKESKTACEQKICRTQECFQVGK